MQSTYTTHAGAVMLRWFGKKRFIVNNLKALQLELIFCAAMGTISPAQEERAKKKARQNVYLLKFYQKRYNLYLNYANNIGR